MQSAVAGDAVRGEALARLRGQLHAARDGQPSIVVLSGEAGIGKSFLVDALLAEAAGAVAVLGYCAPAAAARLPLAPLLGVTRELLQQAPTGVVEEMPGELRRSLAPLVSPWQVESGASDAELGQVRLFAGYVEFVRRVAEAQPVLLVVEDVHWIDQASADLLVFLARALRHDRVMLALTVRAPEARRAAATRSLLGTVRRLPLTTAVRLTPLSGPEIEQVLSTAGPPLEAADRAHIAAQSDGNPFLALYLAQRGGPEVEGSGVDDVLLDTVADLTVQERGTLLLLAVLREAADPQEVLASAGLGAAELGAVTRSLADRGLLVTDRDRLRFRHAVVREAIVRDAAPSELLIAHAAAADGLLATGAADRDDRAAELAAHLLGAGRTDAAAGYAVRGARYAERIYAFTDMRTALLGVRRLWPVLTEPEATTGVEYADLLLLASHASRACAKFEESLDLLDEAVTAADDDPVTLAKVGYLRGQVLRDLGRIQESLEVQEQALRLIIDTEEHLLASQLLAGMAMEVQAFGDQERVVGLATAALTRAEEAESPVQALRARIYLASAARARGSYDEAIASLRQFLPAARATDDLPLILRYYIHLIGAYGEAGRLLELGEVADEALALLSRYGRIEPHVSKLLDHYAVGLATIGRWDDAEAAAREGLTAAGGEVEVFLHLDLAHLHLERGEFDRVPAELASCDTAEMDNPGVAFSIADLNARLALATDQPQTALPTLVELLPQAQSWNDPFSLLDMCSLGLQACADILSGPVSAHHKVSVHAHAATFAAIVEEQQVTCGSRADQEKLLCVAEMHRVDHTDTPADWQAVIDAATQSGGLPRQAYALYRQAGSYINSRKLKPAAASLTAARAIAEQLGARPLLANIDSTAALIGRDIRTTPHAEPTPPNEHGLTRREQQVLDHLADGSTNRRIGRALGISERTVSVHVTNILAKLGAANRTHAAQIARRGNPNARTEPR